jgi:hypothetical protein
MFGAKLEPMTNRTAIGSDVNVLDCYNGVLLGIVSVFLCCLFFFCGFFGAFFFITFETLPERTNAFTQVLAELAQPADAKDKDYDR